MSRSSGGTYTLPSGNPVVTGTTITSNWANTTLSDLATEMTDSLNRSGKGGMLAQLRGVDGTAAAPALSFTSETGLGLYRAGSADMRAVSAATTLQTWTTAMVTMNAPLTIAGALTVQKGGTVTNSTANGAGLTVTGNGTGAGVAATGGATGPGVTGTGGSTSGAGAVFTAPTSGHGVSATGTGGTNAAFSGSGPYGALITGTSFEGVVGTGAAGSAGGWFRNGTAATGTTRQTAALLSNGDLSFAGTANPNSNVGHTNVLGPKNIAKAWAKLTTTGGSSTTITVDDGFNIASATVSGASITVNIADDVSANGIALVTPDDLDLNVQANCTGSQVGIVAKDLSVGVGVGLAFPTYNFETDSGVTLYLVVFGAQ